MSPISRLVSFFPKQIPPFSHRRFPSSRDFPRPFRSFPRLPLFSTCLSSPESRLSAYETITVNFFPFFFFLLESFEVFRKLERKTLSFPPRLDNMSLVPFSSFRPCFVIHRYYLSLYGYIRLRIVGLLRLGLTFHNAL